MRVTHLVALGIDEARDEGLTRNLNDVRLDRESRVTALIRSDQAELELGDKSSVRGPPSVQEEGDGS